MEILKVPSIFQPYYHSTYPEYSSGKNVEEIFFDIFTRLKIGITGYTYIPVFWTSYYILNNYTENTEQLSDWLNSLDKSKKYFTMVQFDSGIFVNNCNIDLTVFSAGGGGLNTKDSICDVVFNGLHRSIFCGNKGTYDIPLTCLPIFPKLNVQKDIFCSFMGRFDTHPCRMKMKEILNNNSKIVCFDSSGYNNYKDIINRSVFTLAPRGYGYTSFRLYEAIFASSIPIYIWEGEISLPLSDEIDWNEFCVIIHSNDLIHLEDILNKIDIQKMQTRLEEVKSLFTFEKITEYIIRKLS